MTSGARRVVVSIVAAIAITGIGLGFSMGTKPKTETRTGIESVSPLPGDLDLRQVQVGVDLSPGYTGILYLDGVEIPEDDLQRVPALNTITLRPQEGSPYKQLAPGSHNAMVEYWLITEGRSRPHVYRWSFNLH
jgi:hypothetical protein